MKDSYFYLNISILKCIEVLVYGHNKVTENCKEGIEKFIKL
jgi:hypothetical protein